MRPCLQTFYSGMHVRLADTMSQRCVYPHARPGQLYCARLLQSAAARRINVLHSGTHVYAAQVACRSSHGASILERSDMQQPSGENSDR